MRRRNRKKTLEAHAMSVPFVGFAIILGTIALGYVVLIGRSQSIGGDLAALESRRDALLKEQQQEVFKWTRMKSPQNLERALREHGLDMTWPSSRQVVRLRSRDVDSDWVGVAEPQLARLDRLTP